MVVNLHLVHRLLVLDTSLNTWTTSREPANSWILLERWILSPRVRFTILAYLGSFILSKITSGPFTTAMVLGNNYMVFMGRGKDDIVRGWAT